MGDVRPRKQDPRYARHSEEGTTEESLPRSKRQYPRYTRHSEGGTTEESLPRSEIQDIRNEKKLRMKN